MMSLTQWNPFDDLINLNRGLDNIFSYRTQRETTDGRPMVPATEITSDTDGWNVKVALPGIDTNDVSVDVNDNILTVTGERKTKDNGADSYLSEIIYGRFERAFRLPSKVDTEAVSARFANGMLDLRLPLSEEAKTKRHIAIIEDA
tara:strand:+ start:24 stop:461 length:438 start_codon:yes stop_codon:yes gene_type:complete